MPLRFKEYPGILDDIDNLESCESLSQIVTPHLRDYQTKDLIHALAVKSFICMYDTGLGKTYLASAYIKALINAKVIKKAIILATNSQVVDFTKEVRRITGLRTKYLTESPSNAMTFSTVMSNDIIIMTHGCFNVVEHVTQLANYLEEFGAIVIDEMHLMSNFTEATRSEVLNSVLSRFEYKLGLTATPITTEVDQLAKALHMINPSQVPDWKRLSLDIKNYSSSIIDASIRDLFVVRQREFNNHKGHLFNIPAMPHQVGAKGFGMFEITKGEGADLQHQFVYEVAKIHEGERGLIYANLHSVQKALKEALINKGLRVALINGEDSRQEKSRLAEEYRSGMYDVVITNITTSIDLTSDYVMFYEYTSSVKQVIGRAERTLESKHLPIYFLVTDDTDEMDYFIRNIYEKSQIVEDILGMDYSEITKLKKTRVF